MMPAKQFLRETFEYEYCAECGGDTQHHVAVIVLGNWFAMCRYAPTQETDWKQHPVITRFHKGEVVIRT